MSVYKRAAQNSENRQKDFKMQLAFDEYDSEVSTVGFASASCGASTESESDSPSDDLSSYDDEKWATLDRVSNIVGILLTGVVDTFGIVGNILLVVCLARRRRLTSMLRILLGLSVADALLLLANFVFQCLPYAHLISNVFDDYSAVLEPYTMKVWPFSMTVHCVGILLTVYICVSSISLVFPVLTN
jgi:hypothetical protein